MDHSPTHRESKPKTAKPNVPFFAPAIQKKLSVGRVNDSYEVEADYVADRVMRIPDSGTQNFSHTGSIVQRKCAHCEEEEKIQKKSLGESITPFIQKSSLQSGSESQAPNHIENQINTTKGSGNSMDHSTKHFMESRFETDFSDVRIHTGSQAVQMSRELNAQAFTVGKDVYFNEGKYSKNSYNGKHLLAHELTHTVQQGGGVMQKKIQRQDAAHGEAEMGTEFPTGIEIPFSSMDWDDKFFVEFSTAMEPFAEEIVMLCFFLLLFILAGIVAAAYLEPVLLFIGMEFPLVYAWIMANLAIITALAETAGLTLVVYGLFEGTREISEGLLLLQRGVESASSMSELRSYGTRAGRLFAGGIVNLALSTVLLNQWLTARGLTPPRNSPVRSRPSLIPAAEDTSEAVTANSGEASLPLETVTSAHSETFTGGPVVEAEALETGITVPPESTASESPLVSEAVPLSEAAISSEAAPAIEVEVLDSAAAGSGAESSEEVTQSLLAEPLTPYEMFRTLISETVFRGRVAAGRIIHHGSDTRIIMQILDAEGRRVLIAIGRNSSPVHAENALIRRILHVIESYRARLPGGEIQIVVNQHVCPQCITDLTTFAANHGISTVTSHIFRRTALRGSGMASPRTTFSTIASPSVKGSSVEVTDTVLYQGPGS